MGRPKGSKNKAVDNDDDDELGSNVRITKKMAKEHAEEYIKRLEDLATIRGSVMSESKEQIERVANETGLKRSTVREALADAYREYKLKKKLKEMEPDAKAEREKYRFALGLGQLEGTPLGQAAGAAGEGE